MPDRRPLKRFSKASWQAFIAESPAPHNQRIMEGVVAGCAIVAYADGWVTDNERQRMAGLIRGFEPMADFGLDDVLGYFEEITARFADVHEVGEREALTVLARLKGEKRFSPLLVETCCAIAAADGDFDAEEREAVVRICEALGLNPADFDLTDAH